MLRALCQLADRPRRDGETAFPDLGTILDYTHKRGVYEPGLLRNSAFKTQQQRMIENSATPHTEEEEKSQQEYRNRLLRVIEMQKGRPEWNK